MHQKYEAIVIGAGAAGLFAATHAAQRGRSTLLLEKNARPGVKILMSGGTRCNLTHNTDVRGIVAAYGVQGKFLHSALAALGPRDVVEWIEAEGVKTKIESTGKIFPESNKAADVLAALLRRLDRSGCPLATAEPVSQIERLPVEPAEPSAARFRVTTAQRVLEAESVIITTGGCSYPGSGTRGDGYAWVQELGHSLVAVRPALVPITTEAGWVRELKGITIPDVELSVIERPRPGAGSGSKRPLAQRRGSLLFAHFGLSGPVALDVSRVVSSHPKPRELELLCDFLPQVSQAELEAQISGMCQSAGKKTVSTLIPDLLPKRLASTLLQSIDVLETLPCAELKGESRRRLAEVLKRCRIPVTGTLGFEKAEVTAGGVPLAEVDSRTMQSKRVPGLYLAGEILDLDGPIGGFNFQAAFSTGWLAGGSA
jgi:predicted Rossmann fold flavoprotein